NLFNLYIALSRSSGRSSIHLLQEFDDDVFWKSHCNKLLLEDDRLEEENNKTLNWWSVIKRNIA
ncbi:hypothetical protein PISMIDRAFT_104735, partial [Pisolithus microcarpus 441]